MAPGNTVGTCTGKHVHTPLIKAMQLSSRWMGWAKRSLESYCNLGEAKAMSAHRNADAE